MADQDTSREQAELIRKLEHLERQIRQHDESQKSLRYISLTGVMLILMLFIIFIYRLVNYGMNYEYQVLLERIAADSVTIIQPEAEILVRDLRDELLPKFTKELSNEIERSLPEIRSSATALGATLSEKIKQRAEERLLETMISSLEGSEDEIKSIFPDMSAEELERQIGNSIGYYVEELHDVLEDRVAFVAASLDGLKSAVEQLEHSEGAEHFIPKTRTEAEAQLLDALLDLVVYEIRPELGDQVAKPSAK